MCDGGEKEGRGEREGERERERERERGRIIDLSLQAMAYFVHVMETVVHKDYVLVYFHTTSDSDNQPDSNFFKQLYGMVDDRYV